MISCPTCRTAPSLEGSYPVSGYCDCRRFYVFSDGDDPQMLEFNYSSGSRRAGQTVTWKGGFLYHSSEGYGYGVLLMTQDRVLESVASVADAALADEVLGS